MAESGLVVVDKSPGMTSHDVVARVRRLAGTRKVGHAGTLDPMATGVLVLGVERATRLLGHLMLTEKAYDATVRLGVSTTTDDAEGEVVAATAADFLQPGLVDAEFGEQVGEIMQVPTAVSAIKVDGQRAYARVRAGEQVELKARPVTIHSLAVLGQRVVGDHLDVDISVRCSSGTYIRAIARDVGAALGVGGHLTALRRTAVGPFDLASAHTLDELADDFTLCRSRRRHARRSPPSTWTRSRRPTCGSVDPSTSSSTVPAHTRSSPPDGEFLALYEPAGAGSAGGGLRRVVRLPVRVVRGLDRSGTSLARRPRRRNVSPMTSAPTEGDGQREKLMTLKTIGAALVSAALVASLAGTAVTAEAAPTTSKAAASTAVTIDAKRMITMPATVQPGVNEFVVTEREAGRLPARSAWPRATPPRRSRDRT